MNERDPKFTRALVFFYPIIRFIFRIEIKNLEKIPTDSVVFVANHNIGAVIEIVSLIYAWEKRFEFKYTHSVYGLAHRFAFRIPFFSTFLRKFGTVPAEFASAKSVLQNGSSLLIFPGGNWEVTRSFSHRNKCEFHGQKGWIRVAKESNKRIVPIAILGSHSINPVFCRSRILVKVLMLDRILRLRWFPVSIGQIIWCALFVVNFIGILPVPVIATGGLVLFVVTPFVPVWPAKITIIFADAVDSKLPEEVIYETVVGMIETCLENT